MAIKDKWVFQKRETEKPWAFLIVKEYDKSKGRTADCIDYTFYHEDVQNVEHCISEVCVKYDTVTGYVDHLLAVASEYSSVHSQDRIQLTREMTVLLLS